MGPASATATAGAARAAVAAVGAHEPLGVPAERSEEYEVQRADLLAEGSFLPICLVALFMC